MNQMGYVPNPSARAMRSGRRVDTTQASCFTLIFGEDTPFELIERLHPDVLVKGADYTVEQVVGADLVSGWGGTIVLADLKDGFSTTATIERLNKNRS